MPEYGAVLPGKCRGVFIFRPPMVTRRYFLQSGLLRSIYAPRQLAVKEVPGQVVVGLNLVKTLFEISGITSH